MNPSGNTEVSLTFTSSEKAALRVSAHIYSLQPRFTTSNTHIPPDCLVLVNTRRVFLAPAVVEPKERFAAECVAGAFQDPGKHSQASLEKNLFHTRSQPRSAVRNRTLDSTEPFNKPEKCFEEGKSESPKLPKDRRKDGSKDAAQKVICNEILHPTYT